MSVLVTMRVKVHDFEGTRKAVAKYGAAMKKGGCHWYRVYQKDGDDKEVLWMMEFDSHDAFEKSGKNPDFDEEDFVKIIDPAGDWDDAVWKVSLEG
jgi:quinol monooxygenase YgiN